MKHRIVIERLFSLGSYQNVKVIVETLGIPDEAWNDVEQMEVIRAKLQAEVMANFSSHMLSMSAFKDDLRDGNYLKIYEDNTA